MRKIGSMKRIVAIFAALIAAVSLSAQIKVDCYDVVGVNETFSVTFTLSESPSDFNWSQGDDFQLVWGPQTGSSTSVSIINGKRSTSSQYTFTYYILARKTGTFTLPSATATVGGRQETSRTAVVKVVSNGSEQSQQDASSADSPNQTYESRRTAGEQEIFMKLMLSKNRIVVGEPVTAVLKLYTNGDLAGFEDVNFPVFNGFQAQQVYAPQRVEFNRESVGDKIYSSAVLGKWVIVPQKSGELTVSPAELVCLVQKRISYGTSEFDRFFDDYQTIRKRLTTPEYKINVANLPAGAPASFNGAVGQYRINASLDKNSLNVNDAISLTISIKGKGNLAYISAPNPNLPPDSEAYDTRVTDKMEEGSGGTSGTKIFEYPFIPRSHGDFTIDPVEFSYYDVSAGRYVTLLTQPLDYHVERGSTDGETSSPGDFQQPSIQRKNVRNLSEDVHYIRTTLPEFISGKTFLIGGSLFWALLAGMLVTTFAIWAFVTRMRKNNSDIVMVRTRGASKAARKRLKAAKGYLVANLSGAFYEELHKALLGYAADKMNISGADMSKDVIAAAFADAGADQEHIASYLSLLDECEFARYAPSQTDSAMKVAYDQAVDIISTLDSMMKKKISHASIKAVVALLMLTPCAITNAETMNGADSLWNAGVQAYSQGDYDSAFNSFAAIEDAGLASEDLYVNMGNASYRQQNIGTAVLYYERALKMNPANKDARYNLGIVNRKIQDQIDNVPEFFLKNWNRNISRLLPSNAWTILFFVFLVIFCSMLLAFLLSKSIAWRKTGFFSAIAALLLMIPCIAYALRQRNDFEVHDSAVIVSSVCGVKNEPDGKDDLFVLHEGTKVKVLGNEGIWTNVQLSDGREGWMLTSQLGII